MLLVFDAFTTYMMRSSVSGSRIVDWFTPSSSGESIAAAAYSNWLIGFPKVVTDTFQRVLNAAARVVTNCRKYDHSWFDFVGHFRTRPVPHCSDDKLYHANLSSVFSHAHLTRWCRTSWMFQAAWGYIPE